jgi:hypothetical protein
MGPLGRDGRPGLRAGAFVFLLATALASAAPASAGGAVEVTLDEDARGHVLVGTFHASVTPDLAWTVLTDYDALPAFVSSLKESRADRATPGVVRVRQRGVGRAGFFRREMVVTLEITEQPPWRIHFRDVAGESFSAYDGSWAIAPDEGGTVVRYELRATPKGALPGAIARRVTRSNVARLLDEVRQEMVRRRQAPSAD